MRLNVLYGLQDGKKRFNERKESTGASSRTLSQTLDTLAEYGLVTEDGASRSHRRLLQPHGAGRALEVVFSELDAWSREHRDVTEHEDVTEPTPDKDVPEPDPDRRSFYPIIESRP